MLKTNSKAPLLKLNSTDGKIYFLKHPNYQLSRNEENPD